LLAAAAAADDAEFTAFETALEDLPPPPPHPVTAAPTSAIPTTPIAIVRAATPSSTARVHTGQQDHDGLKTQVSRFVLRRTPNRRQSPQSVGLSEIG
jgi:hypothetical protein